MTLTHGYAFTSDRGMTIALFSRPVVACRPSGPEDLVVHLPEDLLDRAPDTSVEASVEGESNKEGPPRWRHPMGGAPVEQQTTFVIRRGAAGRLRGELHSMGSMYFGTITKGERFDFRASGSIDVPICE